VFAAFFSKLKRNKLSFLIGALFAVSLFVAVSCDDRQTRETPNVELRETTEKQNPEASVNRPAQTKFEQNLPAGLILPEPSDIVLSRILKDYGAIFVARGGVILPPKIMFENAEECAAWQASVPTSRENFGVVNVELQDAAMRALIAARNEMRSKNLNVTARGTWAARRDYADTVKIWLTRVVPGLAFWTQRGKISPAEAARIRSLAAPLQVAEILRLEANNIFFSKDFSKSILYSATAPGCSQHLSMLAIDLNENANPTVRRILAKHGWYQTVISDLPHFTFLGAAEEELPGLGLKKISKENRVYWIPE
jgi:hypothetical protein